MKLKQLIEEERLYLQKNMLSEMLFVFYQKEIEPRVYIKTFDDMHYYKLSQNEIVIFDTDCKSDDVMAIFSMQTNNIEPTLDELHEFTSLFKAMIRKEMYQKRNYQLYVMEREL